MAESKRTKKPKTPDSFADDLDSMLNLDESSDQQVGLIDDDEAIDRLLMTDAFDEEEPKEAELSDIGKLISGEVEKNDKAFEDYDEFGDDADYFIPDFQLKPDGSDAISKVENTLLDEPERENDTNPTESDSVEEVDEFNDDAPAITNIFEPSREMSDELEQMTEIDEFSVNDTEQASHNHGDFLIDDFDISADDIDEPLEDNRNVTESKGSSTSSEVQSVAFDEPVEDELVSDVDDSTLAESELVKSEVGDDERQVSAEFGISELENLQVQLTEKIAAVSGQLDELKKQQIQLRHQIEQKGNQDELAECLENVDTLRTEQRKVKRAVDMLVNQKPVSAYVANALAIIALVVGGGLGFQGYIAKLQLAELADFLKALQEQVNAGPTADTAEKEMLRKQLDELALSNSVTSNQVAELSKVIHGDENDGSNSGWNKRLDKLNDQDMQMGAILESLQNKVAALEKGKTSVATTSVKKKPVIQENWAVNLVAYKQDWYAKRKAEEFVSKGIPAQVNKVLSKGETWYRLVVDGFKSQYEAAAYAARVKKTLNLDSVWVAKNKK